MYIKRQIALNMYLYVTMTARRTKILVYADTAKFLSLKVVRTRKSCAQELDF